MSEAMTFPDDAADVAVTRLYLTHWPILVRLATALTHDASVAEEIVQEAFVALHRRWYLIAEPAAAQGYLRTSVINGARSAVRHRAVVERHLRPVPTPAVGPEESAIRATEHARLLAGLQRLPRRQREVLGLRYFADLSEQQIAVVLGISPGTVKSHAHRGLIALRSALTDLQTPTPS